MNKAGNHLVLMQSPLGEAQGKRMGHIVQSKRITPDRKTCSVASVAYSFLLFSSDLCNNPVISAFAGTPGFTQKISLDCDEHHHRPQTQGTSSLSDKICFFFSFFFLPPINRHQKKHKGEKMVLFHWLLLSDLFSFSFA